MHREPRILTMELFWWATTLVLMAVGLIGTVLPVFPGTTLILGAALIHRLMLGADKSIGWWRSAGPTRPTRVFFATRRAVRVVGGGQEFEDPAGQQLDRLRLGGRRGQVR